MPVCYSKAACLTRVLVHITGSQILVCLHTQPVHCYHITYSRNPVNCNYYHALFFFCDIIMLYQYNNYHAESKIKATYFALSEECVLMQARLEQALKVLYVTN